MRSFLVWGILFLSFFYSFTIYGEISYSAKNTAASYAFEDFYDTLDFIVQKPEFLPGVSGFQVIISPLEAVYDINSMINYINGDPQRKFDNKAVLAYGNQNWGLGAYFNNYYVKEYEDNFGSIGRNKDTLVSDNDNDGNTQEPNEFILSRESSLTNFHGNENIDLGFSIGKQMERMMIGVGYKMYSDKTIQDDYTYTFESAVKNYGAVLDNVTTNISGREQVIRQEKRNVIIFNIGFGAMSKTNMIKKPFLVLETSLEIYKTEDTRLKNEEDFFDDDPGKLISDFYFNKTENVDGAVTGSKIEKGTKIFFNPKINLKANPLLMYGIQVKFGYSTISEYSDLTKTVDSSADYRTNPAGDEQDIYSSYNEHVEDYSGTGGSITYGFKVEQIYKPKFFIIGLGIDLTVENKELNINGTKSYSTEEIYSTTDPGYLLVSNKYSGENARYILTEDDDINVTDDQKQITTQIDVPIGIQFDISDSVKLRTGYHYQLKTIVTKNTRVNQSSGSTKTTTIYTDPALTDSVVYSGQGSSDTEENEITVTRFEHNALTLGFGYMLSKKIQMDVSGLYMIESAASILDINTKILF